MDVVGFDCSLQALLTFYISAADKDVDVLADLAQFCKDTVAKGGVSGPEVFEDSLNSFEIPFEVHLGLTVRERL